ncbi:MAG: VWA domain-containing protein [Oscillospiraceae bacterium]|nr:VWA domain-containing protein [Oscillospiraceae bacterium]
MEMEEKEFDFGLPNKILPVFFVIDSSAGMSGAKTDTVNAAMRKILRELPEIKELSFVDLRVAVLAYANDCQWVRPMPAIPEAFEWTDLKAGGEARFGEACKELARKMTTKENGFLQRPSSGYPPIVILLAGDEYASGYEAGLDVLLKNNWFKHSLKFALPIGSGYCLRMMEAFTGMKETVLNFKSNPDCLCKTVKSIVENYCRIYNTTYSEYKPGILRLLEALKQDMELII